jgi:hypothetical protein
MPAPPQFPVIFALNGYTSILFACNALRKLTSFSATVMTLPSALISNIFNVDDVRDRSTFGERKNASATATITKRNTRDLNMIFDEPSLQLNMPMPMANRAFPSRWWWWWTNATSNALTDVFVGDAHRPLFWGKILPLLVDVS